MADVRAIEIANFVVTRAQTLSGGATVFTAALAFSFGFTDGDLGELRVVVRPYDMRFEPAGSGSTENKELQDVETDVMVGVLKMVDKTDVADIKNYFNLSVGIANLFPENAEFTIGSSKVLFTEKRPFPLFDHNTQTMDVRDKTQTRFDSRWICTFKETVEQST